MGCVGDPYISNSGGVAEGASVRYVLPTGGSAAQLYVADVSADLIPAYQSGSVLSSTGGSCSPGGIIDAMPAIPLEVDYTPPLQVEVR